MSESSYRESEDEFNFKNLTERSSIKLIRPKNKLLMELDPKNNKKRSSSASINFPKNFVPKLKPIKAKICPSPIILNEKPPQNIYTEVQNITTSTSSFDSKKEFKTIRIKMRKSIKLINEKVYPISDCENIEKNKKNYFNDSDSSKSGEDSDKNNNNINIKLINKNKIKNNINKMRLRMTNIRKNFKKNNVFDDSNLGKNFKEKTYQIFKNIQSNFIDNFEKNKSKNLYGLDSIRYRNKSHHYRKNYIPTILGFLVRNKSSFSLNSTGK